LRLRQAVWPVVGEGAGRLLQRVFKVPFETHMREGSFFFRASATATKRLRFSERDPPVGSHLRVRRERITTGIRE
jgi:hypothetical protein